MKKLVYNILYVFFFILLLYFGSQLNQYLRVLVGRTFKPMPLAVFLSIYPILVGVYLALPKFIAKAKEQGSWSIDWIKLICIGTVCLFFALAPIIYFLPLIGQHAVILLSQIIQFNQTSTISGVVFGYLVLAIPQKSVAKVNDSDEP